MLSFLLRFLPGLALTCAAALVPTPAAACGGFFCDSAPVDQVAERILFEVGPDSVTMTTQISFSGDAADFAWVLPLSEVPLEGSLAVFSQAVLNALDNGTSPRFMPPRNGECIFTCSGCNGAPGISEEQASVRVHVRTVVGDYEVAVVGSEDPAALVSWLRAEGYRITPAMTPYIELYTREGLEFLALKLRPGADVKDLRPFRFTLPGTTPTIPLRMTALAAEPEMGIVVFVLADQRFESKNWPNLAISEDQIRYKPSLPYTTNWTRLVAQSVDAAGGQGWVTEVAEPSLEHVGSVFDAYASADGESTPEDLEALDLLDEAFDRHPYFTRFYTRVSAEEMTSDPVFGRSSLGDVARQRELSLEFEGVDQCLTDTRASSDPCDFNTCGAGGICATVLWPGPYRVASAGCACVPGATARKTIGPDGEETVICQDGRMSFLEPGDRGDGGAAVLPDACAGVSCGEPGRCVAMNMTPTCVCDQGYVAAFDPRPEGGGPLTCIAPEHPFDLAFYDVRMPARPSELPGGRVIDAPMLAAHDAAPGTTFPMPRRPPQFTVLHDEDGCGLSPGQPRRGGLVSLLAAALGFGMGLTWRRRRRASARGNSREHSSPAP